MRREVRWEWRKQMTRLYVRIYFVIFNWLYDFRFLLKVISCADKSFRNSFAWVTKHLTVELHRGAHSWGRPWSRTANMEIFRVSPDILTQVSQLYRKHYLNYSFWNSVEGRGLTREHVGLEAGSFREAHVKHHPVPDIKNNNSTMSSHKKNVFFSSERDLPFQNVTTTKKKKKVESSVMLST